jgi:hypothetical protein
MGLTDELYPAIEGLFLRAGINTAIRAIAPSNSGGNNRIYRVETSSGMFAAKHYFRHQCDQRDRLSSEYTFLQYGGKAAPGFVPLAYACDHKSGMALYEYVEGAHLGAGQVTTWSQVEQAIAFFNALNEPALRPCAKELPKASEACFSIAEHLVLVGGRIDRLRDAVSSSRIADGDAAEFLDELQGFWGMLVRDISETAGANGSLKQSLDEAHYCVSPSDFGFHNALMQRDGRVKFIDFEYAGIDDPAKMTGDFFAQLAAPVPAEFFGEFVLRCMGAFPNSQRLIDRAHLLRPVYQVKWCCIAMNVFLPEHMARRKFANANLDEATLKQTQIQKARRILTTLQQEVIDGIH